MLNLITIGGGLSVLSGLFYLIIPPKYNSSWYGIKTTVTARNEDTWKYGNKLFACAIIITGIILCVIGITPLKRMMAKFLGVIIIILMWQLAKKIVHGMINKKYPENQM